jgi:hypothetical protein
MVAGIEGYFPRVPTNIYPLNFVVEREDMDFIQTIGLLKLVLKDGNFSFGLLCECTCFHPHKTKALVTNRTIRINGGSQSLKSVVFYTYLRTSWLAYL